MAGKFSIKMANVAASDHVRLRGLTSVLKPMFSKTVATKAIHKALQNIIIVAAAVETFMGFAGGEVKMKAEQKHHAFFAAMLRQADNFVKLIGAGDYGAIPSWLTAKFLMAVDLKLKPLGPNLVQHKPSLLHIWKKTEKCFTVVHLTNILFIIIAHLFFRMFYDRSAAMCCVFFGRGCPEGNHHLSYLLENRLKN